MGNLIVGSILVACVFLAVRYLYRKAQKGQCAAAPAAKAAMTVTAAGKLMKKEARFPRLFLYAESYSSSECAFSYKKDGAIRHRPEWTKFTAA